MEYLQKKDMKKKQTKRENQNEMNEQIERLIKITETTNEEFKAYQHNDWKQSIN